MHSCKLRGCKNIWGQIWRSRRKLPTWPVSNPMHPGPAKLADFLSTSNSDLWYICNLSTYKNAQYLILKIWSISVWSQKPKAVVQLLTGFMLSQITPISYLTDANGCNFFAADVHYSTSGMPSSGSIFSNNALCYLSFYLYNGLHQWISNKRRASDHPQMTSP